MHAVRNLHPTQYDELESDNQMPNRVNECNFLLGNTHCKILASLIAFLIAFSHFTHNGSFAKPTFVQIHSVNYRRKCGEILRELPQFIPGISATLHSFRTPPPSGAPCEIPWLQIKFQKWNVKLLMLMKFEMK